MSFTVREKDHVARFRIRTEKKGSRCLLHNTSGLPSVNFTRLIAHIDAAGKRIAFTHDLTGRTETITDRRGNNTTSFTMNAAM